MIEAGWSKYGDVYIESPDEKLNVRWRRLLRQYDQQILLQGKDDFYFDGFLI